MMPGTQDKIAEDGCNMFCVHLGFIFEGFPVMGGIPMEKKKTSMEPLQELISG